MHTLDVTAVRAFVAIAELKSFTRAAEALGTSQGALSVKLKRLEESINQRLVERTPRQVRLSSQGELFIESAKQFLDAHDRAIANLTSSRKLLKLGYSCHALGPETANFLSKLKSLDPSLVIEIQLDNSRVVLDAFDNGQLDVVIIRKEDDRRDGITLCSEDFGWYAASHFHYNPNLPLPLASLTPNCGARDLAIQVLEKTSINWAEVFIGGNMQAVKAAIAAGLAIGVCPKRLASIELIEVGEKFGLPCLPSSSIMMLSSLTDKKMRGALRAITNAFQEHHEISPISR